MVSLLKSEQARCSRLQKQKKRLEVKIERVKEDADATLQNERLNFDGEMSGLKDE